MAELQPIILYDPELTIDDNSLKCLMSHVELVPEVTTVEITTSCGTTEYPGKLKWTLKASLYHNFDPVGTNKVLNDAVAAKVPVAFTVRASSAPASDTNPEYYGELIPQPFAQLAGDVGAASSVDLEWSITGWGPVPTTRIVPEALIATTEPEPAEVP